MPQDSYFGVKSQFQPSRPAPQPQPSSGNLSGNLSGNPTPSYHPAPDIPPIPTVRLPRSSSLLPPSRLVPGTNQKGINALTGGPSPQSTSERRDTLLAARYDYHQYMHSGNKQPAPSIIAPTLYNRDSVYNRWSASSQGSSHSRSHSAAPAITTTGSSATHLAAPRSASRASHRASTSLDTTFLLTNNSPPNHTTHPRIQRNRTPTSESSSSETQKPYLPLPGLPTFEPLGSLEHDLRVANTHSDNTQSPQRPSRYRNISNSPEKSTSRPQLNPAATRDNSNSPSRSQPAPFLRISPPRSRLSPPRAPMPSDQSQEASQSHGHTRSRPGKSSSDSSKSRGTAKTPSQKAMLSRALQKANAAVGLDNNQDFTGARQAYSDACDLLQQVLQRTTAQEDKRKLEAIRQTYHSRIIELDQMLPFENKSLPPYPADDFRPQSVLRVGQAQEEQGGAPLDGTRIVRDDSRSPHPPPKDASASRLQEDVRPRIISPPPMLPPLQTPEPGFLQSSFSRSPMRSRFPDNVTQAPVDSSHLPPHAMTADIQSSSTNNLDGPTRSDFAVSAESRADSRSHQHTRGDSQNSWLDPIDESGGSTSSSQHSRTSSLGYRRRHIRSGSGHTENEFDNALDAAIEAAYDDGFEPMDDEDPEYEDPDEEIVANALRRVEMARERVRQTEREAYGVSNERERQRLQLQHQPPLQQRQPQQPDRHEPQQGPEDFFDEDSSEEEERLLEEMRGYTVQEQQRGHQKKPSIPRESDSSGSLTNTFHSSMGSNPPTGTSSLTTVTEVKTTEPRPAPSMPTGPAPAPPPTGALPDLPPPRAPSAAQGNVQNRRKSLQNHKQLKIETTRLGPQAPAPVPVEEPVQQRPSTSHARAPSLSTDLVRPMTAPRRPTSPVAEGSPTETRPLGSPFRSAPPHGEDKEGGRPSSPSISKLKKNFSASSLRSLKTRNMSITNLDGEESPGTPSSAHWNTSSRAPAMPALPTPLAASLRAGAENASGGMHLLDDNFHALDTPFSPNHVLPNIPVPLEPCPTDFMLRPFWLMRCLFQTLVHPKGGYLSSKLFVPRDAWRVKGAKLKNVEDKIANCDFLTAALLKLARVDTCDADAMLEEMQSMEGVLEQTQASLTRKLGNEVGVHGAAASFKEAYGNPEESSSLPRTASVSGKSSFSWRRLRSQKSAAALGNLYNHKQAGASKDTLATLPMTTQPTSRPAKRDLSHAHFDGPNAHYMGSLARLFDAAQVIDQIARQVEDPGLRHADKTQVGLELCTRHAAEFFGFYICRFVLADLGMLMDKFIKRGSEWVLA